MVIIRNGVEIILTAEELEQAYREQQERYRLQDARRQMMVYFGADDDYNWNHPDNQKASKKFKEKYGVHLCEAVSFEDPYGLLGIALQQFEANCDCNLPENDIWQTACVLALDNWCTEKPQK